MNKRTTNRVAGDTRVRKDADTAERGNPAAEQDSSRQDEGLGFTAEERRAFIRSEFTQEALPSVPKIDGFHLCWLATNNSYDPINKRMRLGYRPVSADDIPGFENLKLISGEFAGAISCNEMVLFKIPELIYQEIMAEFHHYMPLEEEEALKRQLETPPEGAVAEDRSGRKLGEVLPDSDFEELGKNRRVPTFV